MVVVETKGIHLKQYEDTDYKRSVFHICAEQAAKKDWAEFVPAIRNKAMRFDASAACLLQGNRPQHTAQYRCLAAGAWVAHPKIPVNGLSANTHSTISQYCQTGPERGAKAPLARDWPAFRPGPHSVTDSAD